MIRLNPMSKGFRGAPEESNGIPKNPMDPNRILVKPYKIQWMPIESRQNPNESPEMQWIATGSSGFKQNLMDPGRIHVESQ